MASSRRVVRVSGRAWWVIGVASRTSAVNAMLVCAAVCELLVGLLFLTMPSMSLRSFEIRTSLRRRKYHTFPRVDARKLGTKGSLTDYIEALPVEVKSLFLDHVPTEKIVGTQLALPQKDWLNKRSKDVDPQEEKRAVELAAEEAYKQWISGTNKPRNSKCWQEAIKLIFQAVYANGTEAKDWVKNRCCSTSQFPDLEKDGRSKSLWKRIFSLRRFNCLYANGTKAKDSLENRCCGISLFHDLERCDKSKPLWKQYVSKLEVPSSCKEQICRGLQEAYVQNQEHWGFSQADFTC